MSNYLRPAVYKAAARVHIPTANIIFIEKRRSFPASYEQGRRAALARSLGRTRNVFLTKMDALLSETKRKSSLPKSGIHISLACEVPGCQIIDPGDSPDGGLVYFGVGR